MSSPLTKTLAACGLALTLSALVAAPAQAVVKKARAHATKPATPKTDNADIDAPDVKDTTVVEYRCELGNKVTIFQNQNDLAHIAIRWKDRIHRLTRVGTSTGALRFENPYWGLIWIGIPAKGILLDSKHNHQLANECKTPDQAQVPTAPARQG
jgi:hypothetical protein